MGLAKNVNWNLHDWGTTKNNWGYATRPETKCTRNSTGQYCYGELMKQDTPKWDGLIEWLKAEISTSASSKWSRDFDPDVETNLKWNDKSPLNWGQLLHTIIKQIQTDLVADNSSKSKALLWSRGDWYTVLNQGGCLDDPWNRSDVGRALLITIVCLFTGMTSSATEEGVKYPGRDKLCGDVDQALVGDKQTWKQLLGNHEQLSQEKKYNCREQGKSRGCESASMSLVLTVYRSLASLCENCGPYSIARWVNTTSEDQVNKGEWYCEVSNRVILCDKAAAKEWRVNDLRMGPITPNPMKAQDKEAKEQDPGDRRGTPLATSGVQSSTTFVLAVKSPTTGSGNSEQDKQQTGEPNEHDRNASYEKNKHTSKSFKGAGETGESRMIEQASSQDQRVPTRRGPREGSEITDSGNRSEEPGSNNLGSNSEDSTKKQDLSRLLTPEESNSTKEKAGEEKGGKGSIFQSFLFRNRAELRFRFQ
ncbi:hypothetical protein C922_05664, partial [Plasmodium inui San Antonio 1]